MPAAETVNSLPIAHPQGPPLWISWLMNLYIFTEIRRETELRIDLMVIIKPGNILKEARLPKKYIRLFRGIHEVMIPEWLCEKEGLI